VDYAYRHAATDFLWSVVRWIIGLALVFDLTYYLATTIVSPATVTLSVNLPMPSPEGIGSVLHGPGLIAANINNWWASHITAYLPMHS
jgi:hypothetical protein